MRLIKQNDTSKPLAFLLVSSSDHISGLTGASPVVTISKNGASFVAPTGTVSEIGNGWYKLVPGAADVGTLGPLLLHATASGADPVDLEFRIVAFDPDSSVNLGLSALPTASAGAQGGLPTVNEDNHIAGVAGLDPTKLDVPVSSRSNHAPADIWSVPDRTITGGTIDSIQVIVQPLATTVQQVAGAGGIITGWRHAKLRASWLISNTDLSGHDLRLILYEYDEPYSKIQEYSTGASEITISYQSPHTLVQLAGPDNKTPDPGKYRYVIRNQTTDDVLLSGACIIQDAPDAS